MNLRTLLAAVRAGAAAAMLALIPFRRRPGRLRRDRGRAAFGLVVRGGARYAASAPRLFATADWRAISEEIWPFV